MKELFEIIGVSGYERNIREYIRQQFPTGDDCITYVDNVGRIWLNNAKNLPEKMMWSIREKSVIVELQN